MFRGVVVIRRLMRPVGPTCEVLSKSACYVWVCSHAAFSVWMAPVRDGFWADRLGWFNDISSVIRAFGGCLGTRRR